MMNKRLVQKIVTLLLMFTMVLGQTVVGFADDFSENGSPKIVIGGETVVEVQAGKENRATFQVKNKGAVAADNVYVSPKKNATDPFRVSVQGGGDIGSIGSNGYKNMTLNVTISGDVKESSYPVTLEFTYRNANDST